MRTIATAIERQSWEVVALCILQSFVEVAYKLPPETPPVPMEVLEGDCDEQEDVARRLPSLRKSTAGPDRR
jgi:hypothetical protein